MTCDTTPIFPHGSREGGFPYMSASTYFPLQHQCWHWSSLRPAHWPGSHAVSRAWKNKPMLSATDQTDPWLLLLKTLVVDSPNPALLGSSRLPLSPLSSGPGLVVLAWPWVGSPPVLKSWRSRAWSCLPSAWSSSCSWQFSSSLASWSPCPHLKVRVHLGPLYWLTDTGGFVLLLTTAWLYLSGHSLRQWVTPLFNI